MDHHKYGGKSTSKLLTCHEDIQHIAPIALARSPYDITLIHGYRDKALQDALFANGASKTPWPLSKHNNLEAGEPCSLAIDFAPYINHAIPWDDTHIFALIAGVFMSVAIEFDVELVWGGDWDSDGSTKDQTLLDWGHVHIVPK